jgi:hypothetical protein
MIEKGKFEFYRRRLVFWGMVMAVLLVGMVGVYGLAHWMQTTLVGQRDQAVKKDKDLTQQLNKATAKLMEIAEAEKLWGSVDGRLKEQSGIRIDAGKKLLDMLQTQYKLSKDPQLVLASPVELGDAYKTPSLVVVSSEGTLKFSGITDELALQFLDDFIRQFPGYLRINSFSLERKNEIGQDALRAISIGESPAIVTAQLSFSWRDLRERDNESTPASKTNPVRLPHAAKTPFRKP